MGKREEKAPDYNGPWIFIVTIQWLYNNIYILTKCKAKSKLCLRISNDICILQALITTFKPSLVTALNS